MHGTDGEKVVVTEDRVGRLGQGEQVPHGLGAEPAVEVRGGHDQALVHGQPGTLQCLAVADGTQLRRLAGAVGLVTDGGDAPAAQGDEVFGGLTGGCDVVDGDVVKVAVEDVLAEQDDRHPVGAVAQFVLGDAQRAQQQSVEHGGARLAAEQFALTLGVSVGLVEHDDVSVLAGGGDDLACQFGEVRHVELRHDEGQHAGASPTQVTGDQVGPVFEFLQRRFHPGAQLVGDGDRLVDHVGNRANGDSGASGDVAEGGTGHPGAPLSGAVGCTPPR